jgi:DNA-binding MarR family transcriptional regulator
MLLPMEKIGLVDRESSERDARVSLVVLRDSGRRIYREATVTANLIAGEPASGEAGMEQSLNEVFRTLGLAVV